MRKRLRIAALAVWIAALAAVIGGIVGVFRQENPEPEALQVTMPTHAPADTQEPQATAATEPAEPTEAALATEATAATVPTTVATVPQPTTRPTDPPKAPAPTQAPAPEPTESAPTEPELTEPEPTEPEPTQPETAPPVQEATFTAHTGGVLNYWLYTPAGAAQGMPLIVYLHGGSGRGDDLELVTQASSLPKFLREGTLGSVGAYVLMPQCPSSARGWPELSASVRALVREVVDAYGIDSSRVSLTGHSMGGTGAWSIACDGTDLFSRVAPLSGSVLNVQQTALALGKMPVWAMVGQADTTVDPAKSQEVVDALRELRGNARITVFQDAGHFDVPSLAYLDARLDLLGWLTS